MWNPSHNAGGNPYDSGQVGEYVYAPGLPTPRLEWIADLACWARHAICSLSALMRSASSSSRRLRRRRRAMCATVLPAVERRQLTVLFCDLVGSTALAARLDPEDFREMTRAYHAACAAEVNRFGGFVARHMGDGVLAYFGYPQAHEDDAERAVRSGLALVEAVGSLSARFNLALQARIGIATGLVVVGDLIGEGAAQEYAALGETPNLAARLQAFARPNTVVISAATRRLSGGLFEYRDLECVEFTGFDIPTRVWQVIGTSAVQSRFEALRGDRITPLVGRNEEMELLLHRWRQADQGNGQIVVLAGEPGIGKSRIAREFEEQLGGEAHTTLSM